MASLGTLAALGQTPTSKGCSSAWAIGGEGDVNATNLITSTLDYSALAYAPPPFALVKGEVRRTEGYVVVMRSHRLLTPHEIAAAQLKCNIALSLSIYEAPVITSSVLHMTGKRRVLSRDSAEAIFAYVCTDLRRGGASMRQWCETLPFQVILGKTTRALARKDPPDYTPTIYASGPRWIPTKERPADDTP